MVTFEIKVETYRGVAKETRLAERIDYMLNASAL